MQDLRFWQGFSPLLFSIQTACLRPGGIHGLWLPGGVSAPPTSPAIARGTVWAQTQHQALAWAPSETYLCSFLPAAPLTYKVLLQSYALSFASSPVSGCVSRHWSPVSSCSLSGGVSGTCWHPDTVEILQEGILLVRHLLCWAPPWFLARPCSLSSHSPAVPHHCSGGDVQHVTWTPENSSSLPLV